MKKAGSHAEPHGRDPFAGRYVDHIPVRSIHGRDVARATDALTGASVLYKVAAHHEALREAQALLEAPPGIAPRLLDFGHVDEGRSVLVTEWLAGHALLLSMSSAGLAADVAVAISAMIARLHRGGWVHSDLKPANVLADDANETFRLIDFGFAFRAEQGPDEARRGGSPGYAAPELERGWRIDARVDQFALGVMLRELFPSLTSNAPCVAVLERMTALLPSSRFAEMRSATLALAGALGLTARAEALLVPRLGGGPLLERESVLRSIQRALGGLPAGQLLLVHGPPGSGLSRLLLEIACASAFVLEVPLEAEDRLIEIVRQSLASNTPLVVGVADPSPDLRSLASKPELRALLLQSAFRRVLVPRLSREAFADFIAHASGDADSSRAAALHRASDGDLRIAMERFAENDAGAAERAAPGNALLRAPRWDDVSAAERVTLAIVARCGAAPPFSTARDAVSFAQGDDAFDAALSAGWIYRTEEGRVAFTAPNLAREANAYAIADPARLDEWLLEHLHPDPDQPTELRESILRAHRLGRAADEARLLRAALERAVSQGTYSRYLALFEDADHEWRSEDVAHHAARITSLLGDDWPVERSTHFLARALHRAGRPIGLLHLEQATHGESETALLARYEYLQALLNANRRDERARLWKELEDYLQTHDHPGLIELEAARAARERGDRATALKYAAEAEAKLASWAPYYAVDSMLLQASMVMSSDSARALELLSRALERSTPADTRVAILMAMAQLHELAGNFARCAAVAEEALTAASFLQSERHRHRIVAQRAWAWAMLDRTREAEEDALHLLRTLEHRIEPSRRATLHLLLGFLSLHRGDVRRSYQFIATAWESSSAGASQMWRSIVQRSMADTCLDGEAWSVVPETSESLGLNASGEATPSGVRWRALLAQAAGRAEDAAAILESGRADVERSSDRVEVGRYEYHLGIAELARNRVGASAAIDAFDRALDRFGSEGLGYFRAESLIGRAKAKAMLDARDESLRDLDVAVDLARRLDCRRTLGKALRERTALHLSS